MRLTRSFSPSSESLIQRGLLSCRLNIFLVLRDIRLHLESIGHGGR